MDTRPHDDSQHPGRQPQPIDRRAMTLWRIHAALRTALWGLLALGGCVALAASGRLSVAAALVLGGAAVFVLAVAFVGVVPLVRWRQWRYAVDADELFLQHGILVVRRTLVPLIRVQNVDTAQGPIARALGLSSVTVATAARTHEIPALADEVADRLRERISQLAREARERD